MTQAIKLFRLFPNLPAPKFHVYVIAKESGEGTEAPTMVYLEALEQCNSSEHDKLMALLEHVAEHGPIRNDFTKSRFLDRTEGILEFKTAGGARVAYFYDRGSVIVCTHGFKKPPKKELRQEIQKAVDWRRAYFAAKAVGLVSVE